MKNIEITSGSTGRFSDLDKLRKAIISLQIPLSSLEATLSVYLDAVVEVDPEFGKTIMSLRRESAEASDSILRAVREGLILRSLEKYVEDRSVIDDFVRSKDISHEECSKLYGRIRAEIRGK